MARRPVSVKHPHVGLLECGVCHPPAAPGISLHAGGPLPVFGFAKRMALANAFRARFNARSTKCTGWTAVRSPGGRRWCPKRAVRGRPTGTPTGDGRGGAFPLIPSARLTHGQAALPGTLSGRSRATRRPLPAGCLPQPGRRGRLRCASRAASRSTRSDWLINVTCSAPGGGACHWHSASAGDGSSPTARSAWLLRTPVSSVAPRLRSAHRKRRALLFGMRSPSDTGRGALPRDAPNVSPVPRLPWGAPYTRVNP